VQTAAGEYNDAHVNFNFKNGYAHPIAVHATVGESMCKVSSLSLSEKIMFIEFNVGSPILIPMVRDLPLVFQLPPCGYDVQKFKITHVETKLPLEDVFEAVFIDNVSNTIVVSTVKPKFKNQQVSLKIVIDQEAAFDGKFLA